MSADEVLPAAELLPLPNAPRDPLARIVNARFEIEQSRNLEELAAIRDFAVVAREYARAKKLSRDVIDYATEIINRAERRTGEVLEDTPSEQGKRTDLLGTPGVPSQTPRQQAGKKVSARSQQLADLPAEVFEANVAKPTKNLQRMAREIAKDEKRQEAAANVTELRGEITIRHMSCAELAADLEPNQASLIFTDPPYPQEFLPVWSDLGSLAAKALRPGGLLVAYTGQMFLPDVMARLGEHLDYWWTFAVHHDGAFFQLKSRHIQVGWKPLLVYRKAGKELPAWVKDFTDVGGREKDGHEWQQAEAEAAYWIDGLTLHGDHVVDPFVGSGTTAAACKQLGRRFTGCDVDPLAVKTAQDRVA